MDRFLWVTCQLAHIYQLPSGQHIKLALESLPDDMTGTYRRILDIIDRQPLAMRVIAKRALTWVITAQRPLSPNELSIAVAIEPTSTCLKDLVICTPQAVIDACGGLLVEEADGVRPIHFTVQEFLETDHRGIGSTAEANTALAQSSIRYILFGDFCSIKAYISSGAEFEPKIKHNAVYGMCYIWRFWDHHVRCSTSALPDDLKDILRTFFDSENLGTAYQSRFLSPNRTAGHVDLCVAMDLLEVCTELYGSSLSTMTAGELTAAVCDAAQAGSVRTLKLLFDEMDARQDDKNELIKITASAGHIGAGEMFINRRLDVDGSLALYGAVDSDQAAAVHWLLLQGANANIPGGWHGNPLQAAVYWGNKAIVEILLSNGANPNMQGGPGGTALHSAAGSGLTEIVQFLLANGADPNIQGGEYGTALQAACVHRDRKTVDILLAKLADVNIRGGQWGTALQAAVYQGKKWRGRHMEDPPPYDETIAETLLANGADVNIQGGLYGTALQTAAVSSVDMPATVETLLARGADANIPGGKYGTALQAAVAKGNETIVQVLLANRADVNIPGGKYGTPLQAASSNGEQSIVELLLAQGADVNILSGKYGTALQAAAANDEKTIFDLLLTNGADLNIQGGEYGTALQAAAGEGERSTVELLLANRADVRIRGGEYGNALQAAALRGNSSIVRLLLANGADMDILGRKYGTAVQAAVRRGNQNTVKLLLAEGADVNIQGGKYGTALQAGAGCRYFSEDLVGELLANGADVNILGGQYGSALQAAAHRGNRYTVERLLDEGADVNSLGGMYGTALTAARTGGHQDVARDLLKRGGKEIARSRLVTSGELDSGKTTNI